MRKLIPMFVILAFLGCKRERAGFAPPEIVDVRSAPPANEIKSVLPPPQRMIIRTANVSVIVGDTAAAVEKLTAAAESAGGYVSDSKIWRDGQLLRATVSLRVPAHKLSATLTAVRALAIRVQSETLNSEEVTQEYIDLESQLRNLEATENELRELMKVVRERSRKASEVLQMHQQMMSIRSEIERTKGRMRYLSQLSAMATLQVELIPDAIAKPIVEPGWQPIVVMKNASRALVEALQALANVAIWFVIYVLPMMLLIGVALLALRRAITVAWKTRRSPSS